MAPQNMPAISIDINMFWQIINFFILIVVFNKYFKHPLRRIIRERQSKITGELEDAKKDKQAAKDAREEAEEILKKARMEAHNIISLSEKKADERKEEILKEATTQRDKILKSAEVEVGKMKARAREVIREEMQTLAVQLAEKIITEKLDSKAGDILVDDFIDKVGDAE